MEGRGRRWAWGCGTQREGGQWAGKRGLLAIPGAQWGLLNVTNGTEWGEVASFCPRCPQSPWEALSLGQSEDSEPRAREKLGVGERPGVSSLLFFWGQGTVVLFWFFFFFLAMLHGLQDLSSRRVRAQLHPTLCKPVGS